MNIENLKTKAEADISEYITKKIIELKKKTGKEVTSIQFTAREKMTGLESYDVKGNDSNLLIVFYVQIMPDDFVMQLHRF